MATPARHTGRLKATVRVTQAESGEVRLVEIVESERQPRTRPVGGAGSPSRDTLANPQR